MAHVDIRKGMPSVELSRKEFEKRYRSRFVDPAFNRCSGSSLPSWQQPGTVTATHENRR